MATKHIITATTIFIALINKEVSFAQGIIKINLF